MCCTLEGRFSVDCPVGGLPLNNEHFHHHHGHTSNKRALLLGFFITTGFMIVEAIGGLLTNSLALLSDSGHMLSDALSLGVAVLAIKMGERVADYERTYGYKRMEILAAFINGIMLIAISVAILTEAYERLRQPAEIASAGMLGIAVTGLIVNLAVAFVLHKGDTEENLNVRAAFLHVLGDLLGSIGAIVAAFLILAFGWDWADPVASGIVSILILFSGIRVTKDTVHVLMEGTPKNVDIEQVIATIKGIPGIISLHDLHIWTITNGQYALSCHVVVNKEVSFPDSQLILRTVEEKLKSEGIHHITIQLENEDHQHVDSILCQQLADVPAGHEHS